MALTREEIQELYARVPFLTPPPNVYVLENAVIDAARLYDATHRLNAVARDQAVQYRIFGMHQMNTDFVLLAGDAPQTTALHEGIHYNGVSSEPLTRAITRAVYARTKLSLGLRRRPVNYQPTPVDAAERSTFLHSMRLDGPRTSDVDLIHLVYTPE